MCVRLTKAIHVIFMFSSRTHSDPTHAMWLPVCCAVSGQSYPTKGIPYTGLFKGLWPHSFHKIMYLYSICLVSNICCDATITKHKCNTNIQELCTFLNPLLVISINYYVTHGKRHLYTTTPVNVFSGVGDHYAEGMKHLMANYLLIKSTYV